MSQRFYICGCARDVGNHLINVFENIDKICNNVDDYYIIIAYGESKDNTLEVLRDYQTKNKKMVIIMEDERTQIRTQNIANARNKILKKIKELDYGFEYFVMMDMDNVCSPPMQMETFHHILETEKTSPMEWDALSFNRSFYYDIWALSIYPYTFSLFHYRSVNSIKKKMHDFIRKQLEKSKQSGKNGLVRCISAFNGFSIYRTEKFIASNYEWETKKLLNIYPKKMIDAMSTQCLDQPINRIDDCEHRYFHIYASTQNGAKICISPMCLF
jgi:hypothetical protein